jgi:hypothetical protein
MKLTAAVLAMIAVFLCAAPVMASVTDSASSNSGYSAHRRHHHHHHRRHHALDEVRSDAALEGASAIA